MGLLGALAVLKALTDGRHMERVTVYLRTSLFTPRSDESHVPEGVMIIEGTALDGPGGGVTLQATALKDDRGRTVSEDTIALHLPWSKVDHLQLHD